MWVFDSEKRRELFKANIHRSASVYPALQDALDNLPDESTSSKYQEIIADYGTHYIKEATLGGIFVLETTVDGCYFSHASSTTLSGELEVEFAAYTASGESSGSISSLSQEYREASESETLTKGGDASAFARGGWDEFVPTLQDNPWPIAMILEPISALIDETDVRRSHLESRINSHINAAAAPESVDLNACALSAAGRLAPHIGFLSTALVLLTSLLYL